MVSDSTQFSLNTTRFLARLHNDWVAIELGKLVVRISLT